MNDARLPMIDVSGFETSADRRTTIGRDVTQALTESGFMYVVGHGLDPLLIARAFACLRSFFAKPAAFKERFAYTDVAANFGYQRVEGERLDPQRPPDLKEAFTMRNVLGMVQHEERWPDPEFRDTSSRFYVAAFAAAHRLLQVLAYCLQQPEDFFRQRHRGENVTLRWLHYPANLPVRSAEQLGAGAHTDYGSITLLVQDDVGGLELLGADGAWRSAPPVPGAIIINTGDLMERWTNGRFRSTVHRVRPVTGSRDRYSIALFVDPDSAVEVACIPSCSTPTQPARFPVITAAEHLQQKIAATHG